MALDGVKQYLAEQFPENGLSDSELTQLSWSIRGKPSPEKAIIDVGADPAYMEVRRCVSRLYCEQALHSGNYAAFTQNQVAGDEFTPILTQEQFAGLSAKFSNLDKLTRDVLRVSTIISSVPLSPSAKERADAVLGKDNYTQDSVEFLADTFKDIEKGKAIYPLVDELFKKYPQKEQRHRITKLLQAAFSSKQHYRHMLYTEGNQTMFEALLQGVQEGKIDLEAFQFWVNHWTINITGFRGHISPKGSLYLTSNTYRAMQALEMTLARIFSEPVIQSSDMLDDYLDKRAGDSFLKLGDIPERTIQPLEKRLLAHIGAMMRLYHPEEGLALLEGYRFIPVTVTKQLKEIYFKVPAQNEPTPTYAPALYENGIDFRKESLRNEDAILRQVRERFFSTTLKDRAEALIRLVAIADVMVGLLPLNLLALKEYQALRNQGKIAANQPLTFVALASKKEIMDMLGHSPIFKRFNILNHTHVAVSENGTVSLSPKKAAKERFQEEAVGAPIVRQYKLRERKAAEPIIKTAGKAVKVKV
jgi:hypothetical protein